MKRIISIFLLCLCFSSCSHFSHTSSITLESPIERIQLEVPDCPLETLEPLSEIDKILTLDYGEKIYIGEFRLTAYCSCSKCCGKWALNRPKDENGNEIVYGAAGIALTEGISVAVDPKVIPYGTIIEFDDKLWIAHDTGGAIKGNRIDVYYSSHERALSSGMAKTVSVFIIE